MSINVDVKIRSILKDLGIPCNHRGYAYIKTALKLVYEEPDTIHRIVRELYPAVAKKHNTTASRAERAIRHSVEYCFSNAPVEVIRYYFGNTVFYHDGKVSNGNFIATLAECIRMDEKLDETFNNNEHIKKVD